MNKMQLKQLVNRNNHIRLRIMNVRDELNSNASKMDLAPSSPILLPFIEMKIMCVNNENTYLRVKWNSVMN